MNLQFLTEDIDKLIDCLHLTETKGTPSEFRMILEKSKYMSLIKKPLEIQMIGDSKILFAMTDLSKEDLIKGQAIIFDKLWNNLPNRERELIWEKIPYEIGKRIAQRINSEIQKKFFQDRAFKVFESNFLSADELLKDDPDRERLASKDYNEIKALFIQEWAKRELDETLDSQQAAAVGAISGDVLVVARAGSGKTRTLVTRAIFLQKHCGVPANNILLLAFNKDAALEMKNRLEKTLQEGIPHVMTFHALAYALTHPDESILFDDQSSGFFGLSRVIQDVIDEHLQDQKTFAPMIRELMLSHFKDDWEEIVKGGYHLKIPELIAFRNSLPRETLGGEYVKSFGEKLIANILFCNDIDYKYERNFRWSGVNYRPDFTIIKEPGNIIIEYFGLAGDPDYDEMSARKRSFWSQRKETFVEVTPQDIIHRKGEGFSEYLLDRLQSAGVKGRRLSDDELWEKIRGRALDKFTEAMKGFIGRCRQLNINCEDLQNRISLHDPLSRAESLFLEIGLSIYSNYISRIQTSNSLDFAGLVWRAVDLLKGHEGVFRRNRGKEVGDVRNLRYIFIDEFQDFSEIFHALVGEIRSLNPQVEFFCVGDDWQAINGFAGSDIKFFENFAEYFRSPLRLEISTNYRSPSKIVDLGNALMKGMGTPATPFDTNPGWFHLAYLDKFIPWSAEEEKHEGDDMTPAVLRLIKVFLDSGEDVVMLTRTNSIPGYINYLAEFKRVSNPLERFQSYIRSFLKREEQGHVCISTVHKYKGRESKAVIILDAETGRYPLIHPNWVFLRLFGDSIEKIMNDERRLFYVALTRSKSSLVVVCQNPKDASPYLCDIKGQMECPVISWDELQGVLNKGKGDLEIQVLNAYKVKDRLKSMGYEFQNIKKCWRKTFFEKDFNLEQLCKESWAVPGIQIEVYSEDGALLHKVCI